MTSSPSPASYLSVLRCTLAGLLMLLVLGGGVELHDHHDLADHGLWGESSKGCHPELSTHLEPPRPDEPRECLGCLFRLRLPEGLVEAQSLGSLPLVALFDGPEPADRTALVALSPPASRGPPSAFA